MFSSISARDQTPQIIRLVVCDDHDMVRTAFVRVLEMSQRYQVVGVASSAEQLIALLAQPLAPDREFDVLLLDLNLGSDSLVEGIQLITHMVFIMPAVRIVVVSMHDDPEIISTAFQSGAVGYVSKASSIEVLQEAIHHASQGRRFLDPNLVASIVIKPERKYHHAWDAALTRREREVMALLCRGQRVGEIAADLGLSIKTVSTHKIRLMQKMQVTNAADLIKLGMQYGLK
ncbi:MAG: response regulator transcription factor [Rhodoferax sp.]|nr:response regulator transcription factor [Rhodoferax sp.]